MHRTLSSVVRRPLWSRERGFCTSSNQKIVASVLFERLPVIIPKIHPSVYAFQEFSFRWRQQFQRTLPDKYVENSTTREQESLFEYKPAPRITEADKTNDTKSLQRALDRRLYLLLRGKSYGSPTSEPVWHFPEKVYESEESLRKCAELALEEVIGDISTTYFKGNGPIGHMVVDPAENEPAFPSFTRFFFKSQVVGTSNKYNIKNCEDFVWVTKGEILKYFPKQAKFFRRLIIS